jgi:hypothetical protein
MIVSGECLQKGIVGLCGKIGYNEQSYEKKELIVFSI